MNKKIKIISTPSPRDDWKLLIFWIAIIVFVFIGALFALSGPHFIINHEFESVKWRTQINERSKMINDLLDDLEGKNYSREHLIEMLGEPNSGNDPDHRLTWSLADCDFSFRHCLCYLYVSLEDDHLVGARKMCD